MTDQAPAVGTVVQYILTEYDAAEINKLLADHHNFRQSLGKVFNTGHVGHTGNHASKGDVCAAVVVRTFNEASPTSNLQVLLDGASSVWKTSIGHGFTEGRWHHVGEDAETPAADSSAAPAAGS